MCSITVSQHCDQNLRYQLMKKEKYIIIYPILRSVAKLLFVPEYVEL